MIGGRRKGVTGQSSATIVKIAIAGIAIGVAVMILTVAIVTGFQAEIRGKVVGFGSHLQITQYNTSNTLAIKPISRNQAFIKPILNEPAVKSVQVFAAKSGIIAVNNEIQGVLAKGVDADYDWSFFEKNLVEGAIFQPGDSAANDSVMLSKYMLDRLKLKLGDKIVVVFIQDQKERMRKFVVGGVYESGMDQFDANIMLCDIRHVQKLNNWTSDQVAGFEVALKSFDDLNQLDAIVERHVSYEFNTLTITDQFMEIFGWLQLQDYNVVIIIVLMILVGGINMISALLVLILERTTMVGLLKAMGARNRSISNIFLYNAAYLIFLGILWGNAIGLGLSFLQSKYHIMKLDKANYYIDHVPILLEPMTLLYINLGSMIACLLMLWLPSMLVSRIDPVKTIRFN